MDKENLEDLVAYLEARIEAAGYNAAEWDAATSVVDAIRIFYEEPLGENGQRRQEIP